MSLQKNTDTDCIILFYPQQELQKKYADELRKYEKDLSSAQKEKELEQSIGDLKKRMLEQQRAIKMNEKNEAQVKKLAEEIRGIKAQKVNSLINLIYFH